MKDRDVVIDIDTIKISGDPEVSDDNIGNTFSFTVCNMAMSRDELGKDENSVKLSSNAKIKKEKRLSMSGKPPRPPRGLSLDAADQKLIKEISELAMIKRARIERMKALKKMKAAKASSSGNLIAMLFTILFCIVILFQGCHPWEILPSNSPAIGIVSSPTSNGATEGKIVGVVDQQNSPTSSVHSFSSAESPSLMVLEMVPGSDNKDEGTKSIH